MSVELNEKSSILVIDDDLINFEMITGLLNQDFNLVQINSLKRWLEEADEKAPKRVDLILINYIIAGINGLKFIDIIHNYPHFDQTPIIMYSPIDEDAVIEAAFNRGVFDFIKMPFRPGDLKSRIATALSVLEERHQSKAMAVINTMLGDSLQNKNLELEQKNRELAGFNRQLEKIVQEKTTELQFANENLKSYSENLEQLIEKKTSENLKLHKNAIIGDMVSGFVHNLRTPLAVINGQMSLLKKTTAKISEQLGGVGEPLVKEVEKRAKYIDDSLKRIEDTLKNLMLKKREDGITQKTKISLNEFLEKELIFLNSNTEFKHNVVKEVVLTENLPAIFAVVSDLSQIFYNLINNSMDAMWQQNERKIILKTGIDGEWVYLEVQDFGPGIAPENMSKLSDPFFTTKPSKDNAKKGEPAGTGLGLHSVFQLVEANDGKINFTSELSKGTTARISFHRIN